MLKKPLEGPPNPPSYRKGQDISKMGVNSQGGGFQKNVLDPTRNVLKFNFFYISILETLLDATLKRREEIVLKPDKKF